MSDRNYPLSHVTMRVTRDGKTRNGWKWELLDFFKLRVECGMGCRTKAEASHACSAAKAAYIASIKIVRVSLTVDAKKPLPSARIKRKNGVQPHHPVQNRLSNQPRPGA